MASLAVFDFDRTVVLDDSDATIINRLREKSPPPEWDSTNHDWTLYMSDYLNPFSRERACKMASLAVFDFDRTVVLDDSDATIINRLREKSPPPEWDSTNHDWTPYMSDVFEHAYSAGLSQEDILAAIATMRPTPGIELLINTLAQRGWDVILLTDANTVFVQHWLKVHGLLDSVKSTITNKAFFQNGRLYIEPCMRQTACTRCPTNLCKSIALAQWCGQRAYGRVIYAGDGRNDYCPSTNLPSHATVFPRRGYPLDDLIKKTLATPTPQVKASVVPWDDCYAIIQKVFPDVTCRK